MQYNKCIDWCMEVKNMRIIQKENQEFQVIAGLWSITCTIILILDFFFAHEKYGAKNVFYSAFVLAPIGLAVLGLLYILIKRISVYKGLPLIIGLVFLSFQILCVHEYYFVSGWDSRTMITKAVEDVNDYYIHYYLSRYPNNLLLSWLYAKVFSIVDSRGQSWIMGVEIILFVQCIISFATGLITFKLSETVSGNRSIAFFTYLVYLLLIGLSPWVSIAYSDSAALFFPALILLLYVNTTENPIKRFIKWGGIGALSWLGYHIKPTVMIPLIAIICIEINEALRRRNYIVFMKSVSMIFLGVLLSNMLILGVYSDFGCDIDPEQRFGIAHFFAMGLNEDRMGVYSQEDADYSMSFPTVKERDQADWNLAKERLTKMSTGDLLRLWKRKLLTGFHDGTFAWTREGNFFSSVREFNSKPSQILRSFYYPDGANYKIFTNFEQAIWLAVLLTSLGAALNVDKKSGVIMLTLLGLMLYLILFETRARYVYIFAPLFVLMCSCGLFSLMNLLRMKTHILEFFASTANGYKKT